MFDRRLVQYFDWGLLGLTFMIAAIKSQQLII
jgi:hypothetical protein